MYNIFKFYLLFLLEITNLSLSAFAKKGNKLNY